MPCVLVLVRLPGTSPSRYLNFGHGWGIFGVFTHTLSFVNGTQLLYGVGLGEEQQVTVEQLDDGQQLYGVELGDEQQVTVEQLDDGQQLYGVELGDEQHDVLQEQVKGVELDVQQVTEEELIGVGLGDGEDVTAEQLDDGQQLYTGVGLGDGS